MMPPLLGTGPRHDRIGTTCASAGLGGPGWGGRFNAMCWTGCNGQMCARDCGPGRSIQFWVPCNFAVGLGHTCHLTEDEIAALQNVLGMQP
jgi:hypothetical protein